MGVGGRAKENGLRGAKAPPLSRRLRPPPKSKKRATDTRAQPIGRPRPTLSLPAYSPLHRVRLERQGRLVWAARRGGGRHQAGAQVAAVRDGKAAAGKRGGDVGHDLKWRGLRVRVCLLSQRKGCVCVCVCVCACACACLCVRACTRVGGACAGRRRRQRGNRDRALSHPPKNTSPPFWVLGPHKNVGRAPSPLSSRPAPPSGASQGKQQPPSP